MKKIFLLSLGGLMAISLNAAVIEVDNPANIRKLNPQPGDELVITNGVYENVQIAIKASGTKEKPVIVRAEESGKVIITGKSNLRIGGEYIEVSGLWFKDGYSPNGAVIEYRLNPKDVANSCRVTGCAIEYFNPPIRSDRGSWILMYGRNNRFDHNSIVGKLNADVTLAVILTEERFQWNYHSIDHNYFGIRPILGSNGGESIRVGTSQQQFTSSYTQIVSNYFEHCDGEVEVVSIKSSDNLIKGNVFYESAGVLALRHGDRNTVCDNLFIGNNKPHTGGVRVVNSGHKIYNNLYYQLKGNRFFAALALMNAVPNPLPNRYHHVKDVDVAYNTFVDCSNIQLCVGKDNERTLAPSNIDFANNLFVNREKTAVFDAFDSLDGFNFNKNVVTTSAGNFSYRGFEEKPVQYYKVQDLQIPTTKETAALGFDYIKSDITGSKAGKKRVVGAIDLGNVKKKFAAVTKDKAGASWFTPSDRNSMKLSGNVAQIKAGQNSLADAVASSQNGDVIELVDSEVYYQDKPIVISHFLEIRAAQGAKPRLVYNGARRGAHITIANGGNLNVKGLSFSGEMLPGYAAPISAINTANGMIEHYVLNVDGCSFSGFFETGFAAIRGMKNTFADSVIITNSLFTDMSAEGINLAAEKDDAGIYSAEKVIVRGCTFNNMLGNALNVYRGGNDESTAGPEVLVEGCTFTSVNNREQGSVLRLIGAQMATVHDCLFVDSGRGGASIRFDEMSWDKISVYDCNLYNSGRIHSFFGKAITGNIANERPENSPFPKK
ncbi:MAG: hypothetical protein LBH34_05775 [Prevotellaceae bacterium]|jgi:poly(beta-D-mannuronate) lyase|nr:hypothetical protein [Prevotellaceae bacterium]